MTRFDKWIAGQEEGKRADMICNFVSKCARIYCPMWKPCTEHSYENHEELAKACEKYLDEEVGDEEST